MSELSENNSADIEWAGESLTLFAQRALYWKRERTLIVADTHFGKDSTFRAAGIAVPPGATDYDLDRLSMLLDTTQAERLIVLGDFFHGRHARFDQTLSAIEQWRQRRQDLVLVNIRGNHDLRAGDPPKQWNIEALQGPVADPPFVWAHEPIAISDMYVVAGHIHPAVALMGPANSRMTAPCFWFQRQVAILPSFGDMTGRALVRPQRGDQVYVVNGDQIAHVRLGR